MTPSPAKRLRLLHARAERITALQRRNDAAIDAVIAAIEAKRWEGRRGKLLEFYCGVIRDARETKRKDRVRLTADAKRRIGELAA